MTVLWPELEAQVDDLNERAGMILNGLHAIPEGVPPRGSWIRAIAVDDDGHPKPLTPWHYVVGWDSLFGSIATRCRQQPGSDIRQAIRAYMGVREWWSGRSKWRTRLLVAPGVPDEACGLCKRLLGRDAAR